MWRSRAWCAFLTLSVALRYFLSACVDLVSLGSKLSYFGPGVAMPDGSTNSGGGPGGGGGAGTPADDGGAGGCAMTAADAGGAATVSMAASLKGRVPPAGWLVCLAVSTLL